MEIALVGEDTNSSSASPQALKKSIPKVTFSSLQLEQQTAQFKPCLYKYHFNINLKHLQQLKEVEEKILGSSNELKVIVKESGDNAKNLYERVDHGYTEIAVYLVYSNTSFMA